MNNEVLTRLLAEEELREHEAQRIAMATVTRNAKEAFVTRFGTDLVDVLGLRFVYVAGATPGFKEVVDISDSSGEVVLHGINEGYGLNKLRTGWTFELVKPSEQPRGRRTFMESRRQILELAIRNWGRE